MCVFGEVYYCCLILVRHLLEEQNIRVRVRLNFQVTFLLTMCLFDYLCYRGFQVQEIWCISLIKKLDISRATWDLTYVFAKNVSRLQRDLH